MRLSSLSTTVALAAAILVALQVSTTAHAAAATPTATASSTTVAPANEAWAHALTQFQKAAKGDDSAIDDALAALTSLSAAHPGHPALKAYLGATVAMQGRASWLPWRKMRHAEDGLAQIDKALSLLTPAHQSMRQRGVPVALETKFVAANTFLKLPSMFMRHERGQALLSDVMNSPQLSTTPPEFKAAVRALATAQGRSQ